MAKPNRSKFDWINFGKSVNKHRIKSELNLRECSEHLGIDHATIYRIENGYPCTVVIYLFLCEWMKVDPMLFVKEHPPKGG